MEYLKHTLFFYSAFSGKSGRIEYGIYCIVNILMYYFALDLYHDVNLDNEMLI